VAAEGKSLKVVSEFCYFKDTLRMTNARSPWREVLGVLSKNAYLRKKSK